MSAKDLNEVARSVLDQIIGRHDPEVRVRRAKTPKSYLLCCLVALKAVQARAKKLSAKK